MLSWCKLATLQLYTSSYSHGPNHTAMLCRALTLLLRQCAFGTCLSQFALCKAWPRTSESQLHLLLVSARKWPNPNARMLLTIVPHANPTTYVDCWWWCVHALEYVRGKKDKMASFVGSTCRCLCWCQHQCSTISKNGSILQGADGPQRCYPSPFIVL